MKHVGGMVVSQHGLGAFVKTREVVPLNCQQTPCRLSYQIKYRIVVVV